MQENIMVIIIENIMVIIIENIMEKNIQFLDLEELDLKVDF